MTKIRTFQLGETIPVWVEVKDWSDVYVTPTTVKLTVTHKDGTVVVDDQAMTESETGIYVYYWTSLVTSTIGWYQAVATITDGTGGTAKVTIEQGGFGLE